MIIYSFNHIQQFTFLALIGIVLGLSCFFWLGHPDVAVKNNGIRIIRGNFIDHFSRYNWLPYASISSIVVSGNLKLDDTLEDMMPLGYPTESNLVRFYLKNGSKKDFHLSISISVLRYAFSHIPKHETLKLIVGADQEVAQPPQSAMLN